MKFKTLLLSFLFYCSFSLAQNSLFSFNSSPNSYYNSKNYVSYKKDLLAKLYSSPERSHFKNLSEYRLFYLSHRSWQYSALLLLGSTTFLSMNESFSQGEIKVMEKALSLSSTYITSENLSLPSTKSSSPMSLTAKNQRKLIDNSSLISIDKKKFTNDFLKELIRPIPTPSCNITDITNLYKNIIHELAGIAGIQVNNFSKTNFINERALLSMALEPLFIRNQSIKDEYLDRLKSANHNFTGLDFGHALFKADGQYHLYLSDFFSLLNLGLYELSRELYEVLNSSWMSNQKKEYDLIVDLYNAIHANGPAVFGTLISGLYQPNCLFIYHSIFMTSSFMSCSKKYSESQGKEELEPCLNKSIRKLSSMQENLSIKVALEVIKLFNTEKTHTMRLFFNAKSNVIKNEKTMANFLKKYQKTSNTYQKRYQKLEKNGDMDPHAELMNQRNSRKNNQQWVTFSYSHHWQNMLTPIPSELYLLNTFTKL